MSDWKLRQGELAPIVLFTYKRVEHTQKSIESLLNNRYAKDSRLFIISDGFKGEDDRAEVEKLRAYLKTIKGFLNITILEREENFGLGKNIIFGINSILEEYEEIIVLEDDIVVSECFIEYMNVSLEKYRNIEKVMAISGYTYPMDNNGLPDYYFMPWFACWGWATWRDRWKLYARDPYSLVKSTSFRLKKFISINCTAPDMWCQVIDNYRGKKYTWAIFFYITICKNDGLVLYSRKSLTNNIGFDGSGENCDRNVMYNSKVEKKTFDKNEMPNNVYVDKKVIKRYEQFNRMRIRKLGLRTWIVMWIKNLIF